MMNTTETTRRAALRTGGLGLAGIAATAIGAATSASAMDAPRGSISFGSVLNRTYYVGCQGSNTNIRTGMSLYWYNVYVSICTIQSKVGASSGRTAIGKPYYDGIYGTRTRSKVIAYQRARGLKADGNVGLVTLRKMGVRVV